MAKNLFCAPASKKLTGDAKLLFSKGAPVEVEVLLLLVLVVAVVLVLVLAVAAIGIGGWA